MGDGSVAGRADLDLEAQRGRPTSRGRGRHPVPDDEVDAGAIERERLVSVAGGVELGAQRLS